MGAKPEQRHLVPKTAEELGVRLFKAPPASFEPLKASARELRAYGYPARPDARHHPRADELWAEMVSKPLSVIRPEFAVVKGRRSRLQVPAKGGFRQPPDNRLFHPFWSGAIGAGDALFVSGQWTVPDVLPAGNQASSCSCATWVGIGGFWLGGGGFADSISLIQAGTDQDFQRVPYAWWEWLPEGEQQGGKTISNLSVSAGDVVFCLICVEPDDSASFYLANLTTRVRTAFVKPNPTTQPVVNNSAEWIVEDPQTIDGQPIPFARYGEVYFDNCVAGTIEHELTPGSGDLITMIDNNGNALSTPQPPDTDTLFKVVYTGP